MQLVEIPTDDEIHDNIVAYWQPSARSKPAISSLSTTGFIGRMTSPTSPRILAAWSPPASAAAAFRASPRPSTRQAEIRHRLCRRARWRKWRRATTSRRSYALARQGRNAYVIKVVGTDRWRALFDVDAPGKGSDRSCAASCAWTTKTLTETWLYQYFR